MKKYYDVSQEQNNGIVMSVEGNDFYNVTLKTVLPEANLMNDGSDYFLSKKYYIKPEQIVSFYMENKVKVKHPEKLFSGCENIRTLELKNMDTSEAEDMSEMFLGCKNLEYVNISSLNNANVKDMSRMFQDCENLKTVTFFSFYALDVKTENMFHNCSLDMSDNKESGIRFPEDNKVVLQIFSSVEKMTSILKTKDIYYPEKSMYVFKYNEEGAICSYILSEEKILELFEKAKKEKEPISTFLGTGGTVYEDSEIWYQENKDLQWISTNEIKCWIQRKKAIKYIRTYYQKEFDDTTDEEFLDDEENIGLAYTEFEDFNGNEVPVQVSMDIRHWKLKTWVNGVIQGIEEFDADLLQYIYFDMLMDGWQNFVEQRKY